MSDWYVGQKVVCVNDDFSRCHKKTLITFIFPKKGAVYTVREVVARDYRIGLRLNEIINQEGYFVRVCRLCELAFIAVRFRPVVEINADISVFNSILDEVNKHEVIDA